MAYAEKRGKGPAPWRVKYKLPNGRTDSQSGFETKAAALNWGRDQEARVRGGTWTDPKAGQLTVGDWIGRWLPMQDVGVSTANTRDYLLRRFILPEWESCPLGSLTTEEITRWENGIPAKTGVSRRTAMDARSLLSTIVGDAVAAKPPLIPYNPALRPRNRGRRTGRRLARAPQRVWATPLQTLLIAERAALLSGADDDFTLIVMLGYTGMRWAEAIGLEREHVHPAHINVEWQLYEIVGFHRQPPKDDSYRSVKWPPHLPVDLPPFLADLLAAQIRKPRQPCPCAAEHGGSGLYVFTGPDNGHHRRGNYARRVFRPACDGRTEATAQRQARIVIADSAVWPGIPVAWWTPAMAGESFAAPSGRGTARLAHDGRTGRCPVCARSVMLRKDGCIGAHKAAGQQRCPGTGTIPAADPPLSCWLPVRYGLTPHGLRHSHKTWMAEDGIPEILAEQRLGHEVPGMRGLYAHASNRMRAELVAALQARWEQSLRDRAAICPHSPLPLLDNLLQPYRETEGDPKAGRSSQKMISQISPNVEKVPSVA